MAHQIISPEESLAAFLAKIAEGRPTEEAASYVSQGLSNFETLKPKTDFIAEQYSVPHTAPNPVLTAIGPKTWTALNAVRPCSGTASSSIDFFEWINAIFEIPSENGDDKFTTKQYLQFMAQKSTDHLLTSVQSAIQDEATDLTEVTKELALTFGQIVSVEEATRDFNSFTPTDKDSFPMMAISLRPLARKMAANIPKNQRKDYINNLVLTRLESFATKYGAHCLGQINEKVLAERLKLKVSSLTPEQYARVCHGIVKHQPSPIHRVAETPSSNQEMTSLLSAMSQLLQNNSSPAEEEDQSLQDDLPTPDNIYRVAVKKAKEQKSQGPKKLDSKQQGKPKSKPNSRNMPYGKPPHDWHPKESKDPTNWCYFYGSHCMGYQQKLCTARHELCPVCMEGKSEWEFNRGHERDAKKAGIDPTKPNGFSKALLLPTSEEEICEIVEKVQNGHQDVTDWDCAACDFYKAYQTKIPFLEQSPCTLDND